MNLRQLDLFITRDPKRLYEWILEANEKTTECWPIAEAADVRKAIKCYCLMFSQGILSLEEFLSNVLDQDCTSYENLDLRQLIDVEIDYGRLRTMKAVTDQEMISVMRPGWNKVFQ